MALSPYGDWWNYYNNIKEEGVAECKLCKQRLKSNRSYNLRLHIQKLHGNRAEIDKHFRVNVLANTAVCRTCNHELKNRLCNLRVHMRRYHNTEINLPSSKYVPISPSLLLSDDDPVQAVFNGVKRKMDEQLANDSSKRPTHRLFIKMDKKTIVRSVIGLIVEDGMCPDLFSSEHFDTILRPMCESISAKQGKEFQMQEAEIEAIINSLANTIRNDFSNELSCRLLTIKIDNDLGPLQNVFNVSALFIDEAEIQNRVLGLIELTDNAELREDHIKHILYKFNIDSNQIISAFWNNSKSKYNYQVQNSEYLQEIEVFKSYPDLYLGDVQIKPYLGSLAQLCLLDLFKNSKIWEKFLECRNLVKCLNDKSNGYIELFDLNKACLPQLDSPWKAGSTGSMMHDLLEARSFLKTITFAIPQDAKDQFNPNEDLWLFIEAFCKLTNYLQKTILKYYNEELHIGDFYTQWLKCKILTEKFSANYINSNDIFSTILNELLKSLENITQQLLGKECVTACLYLDPRFQHILNATQKNIAVEYLKKLWCRSKLYIDDDTGAKNDAAHLFVDDDEDAFLNEFLSHDLPVKDKASNEVFQKIEGLTLAFQAADTNILSFWKGLKPSDPEIYTLSTICFAIPATEIYTKTYYTHVYRLNAKSEMSAFTKESLLYLRLNAHLLDDAIAQLQLLNEEQSIYSFNSTDNEEGSSETFEDGNSNAASTLTTGSGDMTKRSNVDAQTSFTDVSCNEVKVEEFNLS